MMDSHQVDGLQRCARKQPMRLPRFKTVACWVRSAKGSFVARPRTHSLGHRLALLAVWSRDPESSLPRIRPLPHEEPPRVRTKMSLQVLALRRADIPRRSGGQAKAQAAAEEMFARKLAEEVPVEPQSGGPGPGNGPRF